MTEFCVTMKRNLLSTPRKDLNNQNRNFRVLGLWETTSGRHVTGFDRLPDAEHKFGDSKKFDKE